MELGTWWFVFKEAFTPSPWSWAIIVVPLVAALIAVIFFISTPISHDKAWRKIGGRWQTIGITVLVFAVVIYFVNAYFSDKDDVFGLTKKGNYDKEFHTRFFTASQAQYEGLRIPKAKIKMLGEFVDGKTLSDLIKDLIEKLPKEKRIVFIRSCVNTYYKENFNVFFDPLYWPQKRVEEYKKQHEGSSPIIAKMTGLEYDNPQVSLYEKQDYNQLYKSLKVEQWKYLRNQFIDPARNDKEVLVSMLEEMYDSFGQGSNEVNDMHKNLFDKAFFDKDHADKIAWYLEATSHVKVFRFFLGSIRWLRDSLWLAIYLIVGLIIILQARSIIKQGRKANIFG